MLCVLCSIGNSGILEDWTAETRLVNDFTQSGDMSFPTRTELNCFVARSVVFSAMLHCLTVLISAISAPVFSQ